MTDTFEWRGIVRSSGPRGGESIVAGVGVRTPGARGPLPGTGAGQPKRCKACGEFGHMAKTCGRPEPEKVRNVRCGNCGQIGHNRMMCPNETNHDYVKSRAWHHGKTACSRCGGNDHNVQRCASPDTIRPDRLCSCCGATLSTHAKKSRTGGSRICRSCFFEKNKPAPRVCVVCHREFVAKSHGRRTCSDECSTAARKLPKRYESIVGITFGWWTVISQTSGAECIARCRCGAVADRSPLELRRGVCMMSCRACRRAHLASTMSPEQRAQQEARLLQRRAALAERNAASVARRTAKKAEQARVALIAARDSVSVSAVIARERRTRTVAYVRAQKEGKPCADCGGLFDPVSMDFDHRPGEIKIGCVSVLAKTNAPTELIDSEIAKCDLVCANCHRVRTQQRHKSNSVKTDVRLSQHGDIATLTV